MFDRNSHYWSADTTVRSGRERVMLAGAGQAVFNIGFVGGVIALAVALGYAVFSGEGFSRFYHAYLTNFAFFLSVVLGGLFFVIVHHLTRAGWSASLRRPAENLAACMPVMAAAFAPVAISVLAGDGKLYPWATRDAHAASAEHGHQAGHTAAHGEEHPTAEPHAQHADDHAADSANVPTGGIDPHTEAYYIAKKRAYLNTPFFMLRWVGYFLAWSLIGWWYWRTSRTQDVTADDHLTRRMQQFSPVAAVIFVMTVTFAAFDLLMSLSPAWYSTIFGIYFLAGIMLAGIATLILVLLALQRAGVLTASVTIEHYHDLGKYLFAFVFFWGYIAFSQYLLIWYANLPETTFWFAIRGASTSQVLTNDWSYVALALLFGKFLIPFAGLMSRHVKRSRSGLAFWAIWILVFHWVDLWWLVLPQMGVEVRWGLPEAAIFLGLGGMVVAFWVRIANRLPLLALGDPRLDEALAFENI
jgi:hypothetical protein